ncbi:hypothetical protein RchiOBHm_Chr5g0007231 [Rosa chinensis]|uniref:RNase H type-1 domain-containing protein n=1 Tax=Rosa chinensis TaxID=74649 RepID=A0A2P6Q3S6_ROSCH|nr:hypothetical protein RchiOBHm_Chr5g0007231 [Rosa chinensis]
MKCTPPTLWKHLQAEQRVHGHYSLEFNQSPVIFESDCLSLVNSINSGDEDTSHLGRVIEDIQAQLCSLPGSFFQHAYCESNTAAHRMAKQAMLSGLFAHWQGAIPPDLGSLVASYCNI